MPPSSARFHPAELVGSQPAGGGLTRMTLQPAPDVVATYTSPGQYVEVRADHQTAFFVLANEPGAPAWELVLRAGGGASEVLLTAPPGAPLEVTGALGVGFPMEDVRRHPLIVALSGTGIAAGRPVVGRRVTEGDGPRTHVFIGIRTKGELSMRDDLEAWIAAGVDVLVCLSNDDGPIEGIPHATGYVQDVIQARAVAGSVIPSRIFAVGLASMIDALKRLAPDLGIGPEHVHTNY